MPSRRLDTHQNSRLTPIISSCMENTQRNLEELIGCPIRLSETEGYLIDLDDNDVLGRRRLISVVFTVSGDVETRIVFLCPVSLAATLAGVLLGHEDAAIVERRESDTLSDEEAQAFEQVGSLLGRGLDAAFRESCIHSLNTAFESLGRLEDLDPGTVLDDPCLLHFTTVGKAGSYPPEKIDLVITQRFMTKVTGIDIAEAERPDTSFRIAAPAGGQLLTLVGVALDGVQQRLAKSLADEATLSLHLSDDPRDAMMALINSECLGLILGDASSSLVNKVTETNVAVLKRMRAHPKGRNLPISCLVHYPGRDQIVRLAQLGVRDIVGVPTEESLLERRLHGFVGEAIADRAKGT